MNLDIALGQVPSPGGHVGASDLDSEEVVISSRLAVVTNRYLEVHRISTYRPRTAECDLVRSSLDKSKYLCRNQVEPLFLVLII